MQHDTIRRPMTRHPFLHSLIGLVVGAFSILAALVTVSSISIPLIAVAADVPDEHWSSALTRAAFPVAFEENRGQWPLDARFAARSGGGADPSSRRWPRATR